MKAKFVPWSAFSAGLLLVVCAPLFAHHGTATSYDNSKTFTVQATVTEFRYANPHPQLYFDVKDDKGNVTHWSGEIAPNPAQLVQAGWGKRKSEEALMPGTVITVTIAPSRAGGPVGLIQKIQNSKGETVLGTIALGAPAPAAGEDNKK
jgi:hypothetical protein